MKKNIALLVLTLLILSIGAVVFAEEAATTTAVTATAATIPVEPATVTQSVYPTVAKNVYATKEAYIISFTENQLVLGKDKFFTLTLTTDASTKVSAVTPKIKVSSLADIKAGQKVLVRFTTENKKVISIKVLPGKPSKVEINRIQQRAKELALKAKQKAAAKMKEAKEKLKIDKEKLKESRKEIQEKLKESKQELEKKLKESRQEMQEKLKESRDELQEKMKETRQEMQEKVKEAREKFKEKRKGTNLLDD